MDSANTIDLFLCHNGANKPWVENLVEQVEFETIDGPPSSRPLKVFFDKWDIDIGNCLASYPVPGNSMGR